MAVDEAPSLDSIFSLAIEIVSAEERQAYIARACGEDAELRQHVEKLVGAHFRAGSFLESPDPAAVVVGEKLLTERPGTVIGPYKLLEQIGEGGFGVVFLAEQTRPVRRQVALKVLKPGMDTRQVVARFEAERQALAIMDHPNIAKVYDGGVTPSGRPYFVMELVKGVPITDFCDQNHLTPRQRLELFLAVCQAVQHAHQKGIIHRDLKPSNVLVVLHDTTPLPVVIDFGIAKALGQELTDKTLFTGSAHMIGTPLYMSPEQAGQGGLDIDTRSDIYTLGVLLYELLTGTTPFPKERFRQTADDEIRRIIREEDPPRPSTRLLESKDTLPAISARRQTEPAKLTRLVRGELDWIVMKALEKDRSRRYESANGFALDVQRYLADEPVLACPPSARYRLWKFARRNKGVLAVAALVLFFLMLLGSGLGWAVRDRSAREAEAARQQAARQEKVAGQVESIFAEADRLEGEQKWPEALVTARRAEAAVAGGEADAATTQRVRQRLRDLEFIDRLEQIRMHRLRLVEGKIALPGADQDYARAFRDYGVDVEGLAVEASIERLKARPGLAIPLAAALDDWVLVRREISGYDAADWKPLVAVARGIDPELLRDRLRSTWGQPVSETQDELRRLAEAIDIGAHHPATLVSLADALGQVELPDSALRILHDARFVYPGDFWINYQLGFEMVKQKDHEGGIRFFTAAVSIRPNSAVAHSALGIVFDMQKKPDEAAAAYREAIKLDPKNAPIGHRLYKILRDQKKLDEAVACLKEVTGRDPNAVWAHYELGYTLRTQKRLEEAIAEFRQVITLEKNTTPASLYLIQSRVSLASLLNDRAWQLVTGDPKFRDPGRALDLAREVAVLDPNNAAYRKRLGAAYYRAGNWKAAAQALEESRQLNPHYRNDSAILFFLSMARGRLNENEQARACYDQAARWRMGIGSTEEELRRLCAEAAALLGLEVPPPLQEPPVLAPGPTPGKPAGGATLDNGTLDQSKLKVWEFDWSEVAGATQYHLYVIYPTAALPVINNSTLTSSSFRFERAAYVGVQYLRGWRWKVRALVQGVWTDWGEERTFDVAPLDDNKAPAPGK
jgi:serine/threonine protein kinase/tetratricopeptide (TPR) repeat protein